MSRTVGGTFLPAIQIAGSILTQNCANERVTLLFDDATCGLLEESLGGQNQVATVDRLLSKWQQGFELC
jgi:hypothetical protein